MEQTRLSLRHVPHAFLIELNPFHKACQCPTGEGILQWEFEGGAHGVNIVADFNSHSENKYACILFKSRKHDLLEA